MSMEDHLGPVARIELFGLGDAEVLQQYQLGLVTCTQDELRREGFSAKHLDYIAHGLPALVPTWRRHMALLRGSVAYDEDTFASVIDALSNEEAWRRASDRLTCKRTSSPGTRHSNPWRLCCTNRHGPDLRLRAL